MERNLGCLVALAVASLAFAAPSAGLEAGITVARSSEEITVTGTTADDDVVAAESDGTFQFSSEDGISSSDCEQVDEQTVSCAPSPMLVFEGRAGNDSFTTSIDRRTRQVGGRGADTLKGGPRADLLKGGSGGDTLRGRRGADHLYGGRGVDDCSGGVGDDTLRGCEPPG